MAGDLSITIATGACVRCERNRARAFDRSGDGVDPMVGGPRERSPIPVLELAAVVPGGPPGAAAGMERTRDRRRVAPCGRSDKTAGERRIYRGGNSHDRKRGAPGGPV